MKILKILLINILLISVSFILLDFLIYKFECIDYYKTYLPERTKKFPAPLYKNFYKNEYATSTLQYLRKYRDNETNVPLFRPVTEDNLTNPVKPPILIFGCSFAFGALLEDNQTLSYKLQKLTNRKTYNYAVCAYGIQHMLYILQNKHFLEKVEGTPEYAIYVYIPDHQRRLHADPNAIETNGLYLQYKQKGDKVILQKEILPSFFYRTFVVRKFIHFLNELYYDNMPKEEMLQKDFNLANGIFLESKKILSEKYPNIKFVIIRYSNNQDFPELPNMWKTLENEGFIVIDTQDLIGRKFTEEDTTFDNFHPNEQAWDLLVPKLVEKLNL